MQSKKQISLIKRQNTRRLLPMFLNLQILKNVHQIQNPKIPAFSGNASPRKGFKENLQTKVSSMKVMDITTLMGII